MAYKYKIDQNLFKNITSDVSYLLGLIWSDGCVSKYGVRIASKDIDFLKEIPSIYNMTAPVYLNKNDKCGYLVLNSKTYLEDLNALNFTNKKSYIGTPIVKDIYFSDFLRGVFDGDGSINITKNQLRVYIATNEEAGMFFKDKIKDILNIDMTLIKRPKKENIFIKGRLIKDNQTCRILQTKNTPDAAKLMNFIYSNVNGYCLERKKDVFKKWEIINEENKIVKCIGCKENFNRRSTTDAYCSGCQLIKRRCQNRRSDMVSRKKTDFENLNFYRKPEELHCDLVFSARMYGSRSHKNKQIVQQLKEIANNAI